MALYDDIARGLQGFGAGVQGRGPEFLRGLNEDRQKAMVQDAFRVKDLLEKGEISNARQLVLNRNTNIEKLGGDNSDTMAFLKLLDSGDIPGAISEANVLVNAGLANGMLTDPNLANIQLQQLDHNRNVLQERVNQDEIENKRAAEKFAAEQVQDQIENDRAAEAFADQQAQNKIKNDFERQKLRKLSPKLEETMLKAQDATVQLQRDAGNYDKIANEYERLNVQGGVQQTIVEGLKTILGSQDEVSSIIKSFNKVKNSEAMAGLPQGSASDADIKLALKPLPVGNANTKTVASYLRGIAKLARFNAAYNQFKDDYISEKRSGAGLNRLWRSKVSSPKLTEDIQFSEIYSMAQELGVSPETVAKDLEIDLYGGAFK